MNETETFGRTIQLFLVEGSPNGLIIASIHGWTGSVLVSTQSTFGKLLARPEVARTGVYLLYGRDPNDGLGMRVYIGEADSVGERIAQSGGERGFWEIAVVITTSDEALTKGHVRYLEARLLELTKFAGRVVLDNGQTPIAERRRLPEADRANMEAFIANLRVILPVIGLDLLKPRPQAISKRDSTSPDIAPRPEGIETRFEIRHKSGVKAFAIEEEGEFVVLEGSEALKETGYVGSNSEFKKELIAQGVLVLTSDGRTHIFARSHPFSSPSAAAAVILDRNSNGRQEWKVVGSKQNYHDWQTLKLTRDADKTQIPAAVVS